MLQSHRVQELISLLHRLLRPIIFTRSIIQSIISNLCSKVQRILDYKRVSKQFKAQLSNNHQFNSSLALQLKAPSNKFTRFSLNHSSHSSLLSNNSSSSNNSRFSRLSSTKDSPKFSNRNRFSSRLLKLIWKLQHSSLNSFKQFLQPKVSTLRHKWCSSKLHQSNLRCSHSKTHLRLSSKLRSKRCLWSTLSHLSKLTTKSNSSLSNSRTR